jgi:signal transduction histidine kinase
MDLPIEAVWVDADAAHLLQVFVNLLHNAARFTRPGGAIRIGVMPYAGTVAILVKDNGIGIAVDRQPTLFDLVVQPHKASERDDAAVRGGPGAGLAIARRLVERHRGTLSMHSAGVGTGSTFEVLLPTIARPST